MPTEKAHGIQIAKMCSAFIDLANQVELVLPKRTNKIKEDIFSYYGVEKKFQVKKISCIDLVPYDKYLGNLAFWISQLTFGFHFSFICYLKKRISFIAGIFLFCRF